MSYENSITPCPRSGSHILMLVHFWVSNRWTRISGRRATFPMSCGVIRMNCFPTANSAVSIYINSAPWKHTINAILVLRFMASIKTSLSSAIPQRSYNSSKQRIGDPMASHTDNNKQICAKDFSPPERDFGSFREASGLPAGLTLRWISCCLWSNLSFPVYPRWLRRWTNMIWALAAISLRK